MNSQIVRKLQGKVFLHGSDCGVSCACAPLAQVQKHKYLGVWVDECLSWRDHCIALREKLVKIVHLLRHLSGLVSKAHLRRFYVAVFEGTLRFAISVWGGAADWWIRPILRLQKRAVRIVVGVPWNAPSLPVFQSLGILRVRQLYLVTVLTLLHRYRDAFGYCEGGGRTRRLASGVVPLPSWRRSVSRSQFRYYAASEYNKLPRDLKNSSFFKFKRLVCEYVATNVE